MAYQADNAVILAAGTASRFVPLSYEYPKALVNVRGEILIERQIRQLREAGIADIIVISGYKKEKLDYLKEKYHIKMIENREYRVRNNHSSIYAATEYLKNSYICCADNYYCKNPFEAAVEEPYYAAVFVSGLTKEWCLKTDQNGWITDVSIGGSDQWCMFGHAFWNEQFSQKFISILKKEYQLAETKGKYWETIYKEHIHQLRLKMRKYGSGQIYEFDTLDELRRFDESYLFDTRSDIIKKICRILECREQDLSNFRPLYHENNDAAAFIFRYGSREYQYIYQADRLILTADENHAAVKNGR